MKKHQQTKSKLIPIGLALVCAGIARADFYPITLTPTSYNADVVVEKTATPPPLIPDGYTTASMDGGTNNNGDTWHEIGFFANETPVVSGLPAAGTVITSTFNANHMYQFAPSYTAPNAIMLDATYFTNGNLTVTTPAAYGALSFLASGGNGGCQFRVTVRHQDGTSELITNNAPDWFFVANPAYTANGRCNAQTFTSDNYNSANPRLYERDNVLANTTSPITNLFFEFVSGNASGHSGILAVSGQAPGGSGNFNPIAVSGYNADIIIEASAGPPSALLTNYVTVSMDGGTNRTGNTWYERGFDPIHPLSGVPVAGSTLDSTNLPNHHYLMPASYALNNAIYCESNNPVATVTFATPTNLTGLAFLSANANGNITVQVLINHADLTIETNSFVSKDWFNNSPAAYTANGRVNLNTRVEDSVLPGTSNPRLYEAQFNLKPNATSPVTGATFVWTTNGNPSASARLVIFAVSGTTNPVPPLVTIQPVTIKTNSGATVSFTSGASGTEPITFQWQKGTNGVYVNLTDNSHVSGSTTTNLTINNIDIPDEADYRLVASNSAGTGNSQVASLIVLSTLADVAAAGDPITAYQPNGGSSPGAESVEHSIDHLTSKYLNFGKNGGSPFAGPVGFVVSPSMGRTRVSVLRLYTANDAPERDPANSILEGSDNGGASWTLISSNNITMPDGRNNGGAGLDPLNQNIVQLRFNNTNGYTMYRWSVSNVRNNGAANSMQIGEVELLGVADTSGRPTFSTQPLSQTAYDGSTVTFTAAASGTPTPGIRWQRKVGGTFVGLSDGGTISGSQTGTLMINPVHFSDATDYIAIATNTSGAVTSIVATLTVISTNTDVTQPGDTIVSIGDQSLGFWGAAGNPANAIDDLNTVKYQNGGSGFSAAAGFPPFQGPAGVLVTPAVGPTRLAGLRIYTADGNTERDPTDFTLQGSNDGGTTLVPIASGPLSLPLDRANNALPFDPTMQPMQEVLFSTARVFTSYQLTFNHTRNDSAANSVQVGEIELLGVSASAGAFLTATRGSGGSIVICSDTPGTLQSTTNLVNGSNNWATEGPISGCITNTPPPNQPRKFYRVVVP